MRTWLKPTYSISSALRTKTTIELYVTVMFFLPVSFPLHNGLPGVQRNSLGQRQSMHKVCIVELHQLFLACSFVCDYSRTIELDFAIKKTSSFTSYVVLNWAKKYTRWV